MGQFVAGDVVVVAFPFSDLSATKVRPALVLAQAELGNLILCQITSKAYTSKRAIKIVAGDFASGALPVASYVRPDKIFTAEPTIVRRLAGQLEVRSLRAILSDVRAQFADH